MLELWVQDWSLDQHYSHEQQKATGNQVHCKWRDIRRQLLSHSHDIKCKDSQNSAQLHGHTTDLNCTTVASCNH